jgi:hypothetical protein
LYETKEEKEMNRGGIIDGYGPRQMEKDVVEHIPSKELAKWINYKWQFEENEVLYRERCGEAYYEMKRENGRENVQET